MTIVKIYGREFPLAFTTGASGEIADLCPEGTIENLGEYLSTDAGQNELYKRIATIAVILNKYGIMREHFEKGLPLNITNDEDRILSNDIVMMLDLPDLLAFQRIVVGEIENASKTTVEADAPKNVTGEIKG